MALYPPIVASSMPAFNINNQKVRIYYTLSNYNGSKLDEIKTVHITCRRQSSNVNVIKNNTEILVKPFGMQEQQDIALRRYYVEISNEELKEGFKVDTLYKVQLRFSSKTTNSQEEGKISFFQANINQFSEWSTVCIIKPIQPPAFYIDDFYVEGQEPSEDDENNFSYNLADFVGIFNTTRTAKKEDKTITTTSSQTLKTWRIRLLDQSYTKEDYSNIDSYILADSKEKHISAYNYTLDEQSVVMECSLPYELEDQKTYKLLFEIRTKNDYTDSLLYTFVCKPILVSGLSGVLKTYVNEEEGYIKLSYQSSDSYFGNLTLRRTDSKSNFLKWEDLKNFESTETNVNFTYYDLTAESGIAYKYLLQKRDARGRRGTPLYDQAARNNMATIGEWEHAFLLEDTGNGDINKAKQLKLKFDFQLSSLKTNISESKTDTIGSKYPFIRRNGNMYYRSFPCSGLITSYTDNVDLFTSKEILDDNNITIYDNYLGQSNKYINQYDYTYERKFREKVEEFLYNAKPKLYKSMQEGNIFIKLMEVSLTPKTELGRLLYTFSATAYEIDQASLDTFNSYGLLDIGNYNPKIEKTETKIGQISSFKSDTNPTGNIFKAGQDIIGAGSAAAANSIAKHHKYQESVNNQIVSNFSISWLRITVESEPYLIKQIGTGNDAIFYPMDDVDNADTPLNPNDSYSQKRAYFPSLVDKNYITTNKTVEPISNAAFDIPSDNGDVIHKLYQIESTYHENESIYLGTLFDITINGKPEQIIIAYPNNVYEFKDDNITLPANTSIIPYKDTAMSIDYVATLEIEEDVQKVPKFIRSEKSIGQLIGAFDSSQELINRVRFKYKTNYNENDDLVKQYVNGVDSVLVDTEPGAVVYLKTSAQDKEGFTEPYRFVVNHTGELRFDPHDNTVFVTYLKISGMNFAIEELNNRGAVSSLTQVEYPIDGDYCTVNDVPYIFYKTDWIEGTLQDNDESIDISCPVDALVFYEANVRRDYF